MLCCSSSVFTYRCFSWKGKRDAEMHTTLAHTQTLHAKLTHSRLIRPLYRTDQDLASNAKYQADLLRLHQLLQDNVKAVNSYFGKDGLEALRLAEEVMVRFFFPVCVCVGVPVILSSHIVGERNTCGAVGATFAGLIC